MELTWKNEEKEVLRAYEFFLQNEPEIKRQRLRLWTSGPIGAVLMLVALRTSSFRSIFFALCFSLVWIFVLAPFIYNDTVKTAAKRRLKKESPVFEEIRLSLDGPSLMCNGRPCKVLNYYGYLDLFLVQTDRALLIVPERVFRDEVEEKNWLSCIMKEVNT